MHAHVRPSVRQSVSQSRGVGGGGGSRRHCRRCRLLRTRVAHSNDFQIVCDMCSCVCVCARVFDEVEEARCRTKHTHTQSRAHNSSQRYACHQMYGEHIPFTLTHAERFERAQRVRDAHSIGGRTVTENIRNECVHTPHCASQPACQPGRIR